MPAEIHDRIIQHLKIHHAATVSEMAAALNVTRADVRYHLKTLITEQLVAQSDNQVKSPGRGRPGAAFHLTDKSKPDNYQSLAAVLLRLYLERSIIDGLQAMENVAQHLFPPQYHEGSTLPQILNQITLLLNGHQYDSHWEAHASGPRIMFENCPYAAILPEFPHLCGMDRQILSLSSNMKVEQRQWIRTSRRNPPACIFQLANP